MRVPGETMSDIGNRLSGPRSSAPSIVELSPPDIARRRLADWGVIQADTVRVTRRETFECGFQARRHLLIAYERAERNDGETLIEGLPKSTLREFNCKLSVVPAGHRFYGWQTPRVLTRVTYFYIDLQDSLFDPESGITCPTISPRLFFFDQAVWDTALKLKAEVGNSDPWSRQYAEALSLVLMHELIRLERTTSAAVRPLRGGLPVWQQKRVAEFHRGASRGGNFAGRSRRTRRSEPLSLCARLHAILRRASASLPYGPPVGSRQGPAAEAGALGDTDRHPDWFSRNEFIHEGISQGHGTYADRISASAKRLSR